MEGGGGGGDQGGALCFNRADPRTLEVVSGGSTSVSGKSLPDKRHPFSFDKVCFILVVGGEGWKRRKLFFFFFFFFFSCNANYFYLKGV